jgi:hypothetical protein
VSRAVPTCAAAAYRTYTHYRYKLDGFGAEMRDGHEVGIAGRMQGFSLAVPTAVLLLLLLLRAGGVEQ